MNIIIKYNDRQWIKWYEMKIMLRGLYKVSMIYMCINDDNIE